MRTQFRNKRTIYLCKKYQDGKLIKYKEPIKLKEHVSATNRDSDMFVMGMEYTKGLRIKTGNKTLINNVWYKTSELYSPGDRIYVYVMPPKIHDYLCKNADYEVQSKPNGTLNQTDILLRNINDKY